MASTAPAGTVTDPDVPPRTTSAPDTGRRRLLVNIVLDYGIYVALAVLVVIFAISSPYFLLPRNLLNIGSAVALSGIVAAGMTFALIAGVVDLSVGSLMGLAAVVIAEVMHAGISPALAILAGLAVCIVAGLLNCLLVVTFGINSIVATLATATVLLGVALMVSGGAVVTLPTNTWLQDFASARPAGIPVALIIMVAVYAVGYFALTKTRFGWHLYAVGSNRSAASRCGISAGRIYIYCFITVACLVGISATLLTGTLSYAQPSLGDAAALDILTAVLLGGIGLAGGSGRIERTLAGVLLIGVLNNGLTLLSVPPFYGQIARGLILVAAVIMDAIRTKRLAR